MFNACLLARPYFRFQETNMRADNLLPGYEKPPAHPLPEGPRPGTSYPVKDGESWGSVATKFKVSVKDLIANNCGTGVTPEEINWYLHKRVGCNETPDRHNWAFSASAKPGIVYIPTTSSVAVAGQNPRINTLYGGPTDDGCGGVTWMVEFELPKKAENDGWIIQRVDRRYDIRNADGTVWKPTLNAPKTTYWEAWPVKKGDTKTSTRYDATADGKTYDDVFDQPIRTGTKGEFQVTALVRFYEVTLPADFIKQNPNTRAEDLRSTTTRPSFWDATGTTHNLTISWDCTVDKPKPPTIITKVIALNF